MSSTSTLQEALPQAPPSLRTKPAEWPYQEKAGRKRGRTMRFFRGPVKSSRFISGYRSLAVAAPLSRAPEVSETRTNRNETSSGRAKKTGPAVV